MENKKSKFKFLPRKNKKLKLNKNYSSDLIEPTYQLINQLSPYKYIFPIEPHKEKKEIDVLNQLELPEQKLLKENIILKINDNNLKKPNHNIFNNNNTENNFGINKLGNYKKIKNLKSNTMHKNKYSKDYNIIDINNEIFNNISNSKLTKNITAYTTLTIGKNDISNCSNKCDSKKNNNIIIKTVYNNFKNLTKINSFASTDNKSFSKIEFSSITDKDNSNISILNSNLISKNKNKNLTTEDLKEIIKKRKIKFPSETKKEVVNF